MGVKIAILVVLDFGPYLSLADSIINCDGHKAGQYTTAPILQPIFMAAVKRTPWLLSETIVHYGPFLLEIESNYRFLGQKMSETMAT